MDDPYSTVWLESDPISLNIHKTPEPPKKVNFFSEAGKIRLSRIWDDNLLDVERLFTGIDEPSEAYVREKVSDYVQHYLFQRARRLSLGRKILTATPTRFGKQKNKFWEYEDFISTKNLKHDQIRESHEVDRITELLMTGRIKHAPQGFDEVLNNPIYKANRLLESVKKLERSEIKVNLIPFEIRTTRIKNVSQVTPYAKTKTMQDSLFTMNSTCGDICGVDVHKINSESDVFSPLSSGFQENAPSPVSIRTLGMMPSAMSASSTNPEYLVEFPTSDYDRGRSSLSVLSDLSDQDLEAYAEKEFEDEGITGDLEISAEFSWDHAPLALANYKSQKDCNTMYKIAADIVQMFQRQEVVGKEFMERFSQNCLNGK